MARVVVTGISAQELGEGPYLRILREAGHEPVFARIEVGFLTEQQLLTQLRGVSGVLASSEPYTRRVFENSPELRVIARVGVGYDAVDLEAARDHGVPVMVAGGTNDVTVAESAVLMILALAHDLPGFSSRADAGDWRRPPASELHGKTVGVIGLGRIGRAVVERVKGFGVRVAAAEPFPDPAFVSAHDIELISIDDVFRRADMVTLHTPLTADTHHLVNARRLALMKPTALLVNTARGGLVDEEALYQALTSGGLAGAGLDVREKEPPTDHRLGRLPNVLQTPHVAGLSRESLTRMTNLAASHVVDVLAGSWNPAMVVNGVYSE